MQQVPRLDKAGQPGRLKRVFTRPEMGALAGSLLVFLLFALIAGDSGFLTPLAAANYLGVAAEIGIVAAPVALLAIAGEFDLSVGSMVGAAGILIAIPVVNGWPVPVALALAFVVACAVGATQGWIVEKTGLPSFIVTLAFLFILRGATIAVAAEFADGTQVSGVRDAVSDSVFYKLFAGRLFDLPASVYWWIGITVAASWLLLRTRFGNWIFASGGGTVAARNMGVPVSRVKILLFVATAVGAALVAAVTVFEAGSADVLRGQQKEFQAITAAVIGGTLLTGGYGTAVGAMFGAIIIAIVSQGLFYASVDANWFQVFLGGILLIAVLFNRALQVRAGVRS
jgi:simple sugar transport system permease protein